MSLIREFKQVTEYNVHCRRNFRIADGLPVRIKFIVHMGWENCIFRGRERNGKEETDRQTHTIRNEIGDRSPGTG